MHRPLCSFEHDVATRDLIVEYAQAYINASLPRFPSARAEKIADGRDELFEEFGHNERARNLEATDRGFHNQGDGSSARGKVIPEKILDVPRGRYC